MTSRVVCLGDLMIDILAALPGPLAVGTDTPAPISLVGGGSAANTAAWSAAAGTPTTFIGRVGDDVLGRLATAQLADTGVELRVSIDPELPTGACIVLVDADGERTMVPSAGANSGLGVVDLPGQLFDDANLHVSAYAVFGPGSRTAVDRALGLAAERGCPVSVDAASASPLRSFGAVAFLDWLPSGLLFANLDEAAVLTGTHDPAVAAAVLGRRCGEAIVKCGAHGAVWSNGRDVVQEIPTAVDVLDSTGAGDAFAAGVLAARGRDGNLRGPGLRDGDVRGWLRAGNALAARAIVTVGARPVQQQAQNVRKSAGSSRSDSGRDPSR